MYKTRIHLVEPTKLLERVTVDNMRFLNPLGHDYVAGAYNVSPKENLKDGTSVVKNFAEFSGGSSTNPPTTNIKHEVYKNVASIKGINIYDLCFWEAISIPGGDWNNLDTYWR